MVNKKENRTPLLVDTNVLFDILGNETRRRILNLISHEPMYFNQLAKEIQTGQQAILRHVKILEDSGFRYHISAPLIWNAKPFVKNDNSYLGMDSLLNICAIRNQE